MSKSFSLQLLRQRPLTNPSTLSFTNKTILLTGASSGLGLAAATKFVSLGASRLILGMRNLEKGHEAVKTLKSAAAATGTSLHEPGRTADQGEAMGNDNNHATTTTGSTTIEVWPLDMTSYTSVQAFAARAARDLERLDVAVLNAGVYMVDYRQTSTPSGGWEETLQVNTLSTALLALLLLPKLKTSSSSSSSSSSMSTSTSVPVLEVVASRRAEAVVITPEQQRTGNILASLNQERNFQPSLQYRTSKFLLLCALKQIASVIKPSEVTVLAVCPGAVATNLSRGWTGPVAAVAKACLNALFLRTPEQGARSLVSGAGLGVDAHGRFWYDDELHEYVFLSR